MKHEMKMNMKMKKISWQDFKQNVLQLASGKEEERGPLSIYIHLLRQVTFRINIK